MSERDQAYALIDQLAPEQLATALHLLKEMVADEDEELTEEEVRMIEDSQEYFRLGNPGLTFEEAVAECGFTMEQVTSGKL